VVHLWEVALIIGLYVSFNNILDWKGILEKAGEINSAKVCITSTTDQIFCIRQILEKKWEYNETVHQLFVDFKKTYDSVRREIL
jgi:hypothetical protein